MCEEALPCPGAKFQGTLRAAEYWLNIVMLLWPNEERFETPEL
jgi:hypothetical protein